MKRKLVAALLSVAMVASITPVSALGPVASVEAATVTAEDVIDQINKLVDGTYSGGVGSPANKVYYTEEYAYFMSLARTNYDSLSPDKNGQGAVSNYETLVNVEKAYKTAYTDKITAAEDAIKAIPDVLETDSADIVNAAKTAYQALDSQWAGNVAGTSLAASRADLTKGLSETSKTKYNNATAAMEVVTAIPAE